MPDSRDPSPAMPRGEFVAYVAALMAVNALGVDLMLPALPAIGRELAITTANHRQWIVTVYLLGFGIGQLVYGPLADRFGRRPVLLATLSGSVAASVVAASAASFPTLLAARLLQGLMSAATRVLSVAIVRDQFHGRTMARTLSLAQMIFFLFPILAPSIGAVLLTFGEWRIVFYALTAFAACVLAWTATRMRETLPAERRVPISPATIAQGYRVTLSDRFSLGYAVGASLTFGAIIAFVSSSEQIFVEHFDAGKRFTLLFAVCALAMGAASFANSRLVERLGTRLISQTGVIALIALATVHLLVIASGRETLGSFIMLQALSMTCVGLCGSNFSAMAMEPVGHIAGSASSIQGFISTVGAVAVGSAIGQAYDGTTMPLAVGYLVIGIAALGIIAVVERGQVLGLRLAPA